MKKLILCLMLSLPLFSTAQESLQMPDDYRTCTGLAPVTWEQLPDSATWFLTTYSAPGQCVRFLRSRYEQGIGQISWPRKALHYWAWTSDSTSICFSKKGKWTMVEAAPGQNLTPQWTALIPESALDSIVLIAFHKPVGNQPLQILRISRARRQYQVTFRFGDAPPQSILYDNHWHPRYILSE